MAQQMFADQADITALTYILESVAKAFEADKPELIDSIDTLSNAIGTIASSDTGHTIEANDQYSGAGNLKEKHSTANYIREYRNESEVTDKDRGAFTTTHTTSEELQKVGVREEGGGPSQRTCPRGQAPSTIR